MRQFRKGLQERSANVTPKKQKQKLGFLIYEDGSPEQEARHRFRGELDDMELEDKENGVLKENMEPAVTAEILNYDNIMNKSIIEASEQKKTRNPLASKSIVLYPGFLELAPDADTAAAAAAAAAAAVTTARNSSTNAVYSRNSASSSKQRILHLPKKSSPLKPMAFQENSSFNTPTQHKDQSPTMYDKDSVNRRSSISIFLSPAASPLKSKLTNKLLSLASSDENFASSESLQSKLSSSFSYRSKTILNEKSMLGIPAVSSLSSDSLQKQKVYRDNVPNSSSLSLSPKRRARPGRSIPKSSSASLYSRSSAALSALNSPSDKSVASDTEDCFKIRRLDVLWAPQQNSAVSDDECRATKKEINAVLDRKLPNYVTPPRSINKQILNQLLSKVPHEHHRYKHPSGRKTSLARNHSVSDMDRIKKENTYSRNLRILLTNKAKKDIPQSKHLINDSSNVNFGQGINDGYQNSSSQRMKIDSQQLKFKIFADE